VISVFLDFSLKDLGRRVITDSVTKKVTKLVDGFGSTQDAVAYAESAAERYPQFGEALIALARLIQNEQRDRALDLLNRAISFEPNNSSFYVARGSYSFWVQGNPRTAEADFRKAIELSRGTNASAWPDSATHSRA
jgi:Flp pilus assembly protein TadD